MHDLLTKRFPGLPVGRLIRPSTCVSCKWSVPQPGQQAELECRESPPTATAFMMSPPAPGRPPGIIVHTGFPMVNGDTFCGKWAPKIDKVN